MTPEPEKFWCPPLGELRRFKNPAESVDTSPGAPTGGARDGLAVIEPGLDHSRGSASDAELIVRARQGDRDAFGSLYERHVDAARRLARTFSRSDTDAEDLVADAFARVLVALQRHAGPDVAFRPYLLACVRNCAYDRTRRDKRVSFTDEVPEAPTYELDDPLVLDFERGVAAQAFARLPERWRMVLWHTEVEGMEPAEIAPLIGLSANATAALAYRARDGLRQAFLQAQLREETVGECRYANERFGALLRDRLASRERARVETHLDECDRCRVAYAELLDSNSALRAVIAPIVLGAGTVGYLATVPGKGAAAGASMLRHARHLRPRGVLHLVAPAKVIAIGAVAASVAVGTAVALTRAGSPAGRPEAATASAAPRPTDGVRPGAAAPAPERNVLDPTISAPSGAVGPVPGAPLTGTGTGTPPSVTAAVVHAPSASVPSGGGATPSPPSPPSPPTPPTPPSPPAPSTNLTASFGLIGNLVPGRGAVYLAGVGNVGPNPATDVSLTVTLDPGLRLDSVVAPDWTCTTATSAVSCRRADVTPGAGERVLVHATVTGVANSATGGAVSVATSTPQTESADDRAAATDRVAAGGMGTAAVIDDTADVTFASNTVLTCPATDSHCADARAGIGRYLANNDFVMARLDVDADPSTFDSSTAALTLPGGGDDVLFAALVWAGDTNAGVGGAPAPDVAARDTVRVAPPGGPYQTVRAARTSVIGSAYQSFADVTSLVRAGGPGDYTVADVQAATGRNRFGGWSLVVVYRDTTKAQRTILVADGFENVDVAKPNTIPLGRIGYGLASNARTQLGFVLFEGDLGSTGDALSLNGAPVSDARNPIDDIANSTASRLGTVVGGGDPADVNRFGVDADLVAAPAFDPNADVSLAFRSSGDQYFVGVATVTVDR